MRDQNPSLHSYRATVDWQIDPRDEAAFVRRQEQNGRGNLFGPSNPLHWRHGDEPVLHRADVRAELGVEKRCFDRAWADHVGPDALAREFSGPRADKRAQGRLRGAIRRIHRNTFLPGAGAVDDDRTAVLHHHPSTAGVDNHTSKERDERPAGPCGWWTWRMS